MKKLNIILNIIIVSFVGAFIGYGIYTVWDYKTHPELYVVQSTPWYTSILLYGIFTIIVLLICVVIKVIINHKFKQGNKAAWPIGSCGGTDSEEESLQNYGSCCHMLANSWCCWRITSYRKHEPREFTSIVHKN